MGPETRKRDKYRNNEEENKFKRRRSRSRSPVSKRDRDEIKKRKRSPSPDRNTKVRQKEVSPVNENDTKKAPEKKSKETDMLNTRTGGAYIPPARLRMMQAQITDKSSVAYQRLAWEALKKSIHGHINKINVGNIGIIIKQLLKENIVRGRGLLCRSVIQAQAASPTFTNVYAALVAAVNSRFPNIGELLLKRLVIQFKRGFKRNDKSICISSASFVAHLVNQRVAHEILALELLTLLVESPTDDSVEVAIAFLKECGQKLTEVSSKGVNAIFEMLRNILHEGHLDKRVQYMIEVMFQVWKDGFKDHPALIPELELVPEEEQFTHLLMLDDATDPQDILNVFKFDEKYEENEQKYKNLSKEILGSDAESEDENAESESGSGTEESEDEEEQENKSSGVTIIDNTETNLIALRRTIYLTINSSLDFEECAHKLMKMQLKPGQEKELCHMFLDCCAEQRTYEKFFGLLAQRFCNINRIYIGPFEEIFKDSYATAHRLDTNRLRNVSKFFGHLLFTDSISWEVLECVKLNEEDTTSSSRIYIKILFQELAEYMGLKKLNDRLKDPTLQEAFSGIFPRDNPKNTRFSINFFTSIGLGGLTDELREHLKQMPKNMPPPLASINVESGDSDTDSSSDSSDSNSSSDESSSNSSSESSKPEKQKSKTINKEKDSHTKKKEHTGKPEDGRQEEDNGNERWGHDGFYDTYGRDAKRHVSNTDKNKRDQNRYNHAESNKHSKDTYNPIRKDKERTYQSYYRVKDYEDNGENDSRSRNKREGDEQKQYKNRDNNERHERNKGISKNRRSDNEDYERSNNEKKKYTDKEYHRHEKRYDRKREEDDKRPRQENEGDKDNESSKKKVDKHREYERRDNEDKRESKREKRSEKEKKDQNIKSVKKSDKEAKKNHKEQEKSSDHDDEPSQQVDHETVPQRYWDTFNLNDKAIKEKDRKIEESKNYDKVLPRKRER